LVQVEDVVAAEAIFTDYAYFSSYSDTWLEHARRFAVSTTERFGLGRNSLVVELASNDGYLLRYLAALGVPVLGVEPAKNVAAVAQAAGIETIVDFFGAELASNIAADRRPADLVVANNVLAHVPNLNDFVAGIARIVAPSGIVSIEVPHLLRLIETVAFDTIYHEHFSYFSLITLERVLAAHGLAVFDVQELPTHGGSLRVWSAPKRSSRTPTNRLMSVRDDEQRAGLATIRPYEGFTAKVEQRRDDFRQFLGGARNDGQTVVAYGAAAKGNTFLNYSGVTKADIAYVVDRSPHKQGKLLPGSHLPIFAPVHVRDSRPNFLFILPWNLRREIAFQMSEITSWGGRFVVAMPALEVFG